MAQEGIWAWDDTNEVWVKIKTDSQGRLYTVAVIDNLDDIGDVNVPTPTDDGLLYWDSAAGEWKDIAHLGVVDAHHNQAHTLASHSTKAHAELSDAPEGAHHTKFTTTEHSAIGNGAPHHTKYTDAAAKAAAVRSGAITDGETKAPTHDAVFDVKTTADNALPAGDKYTNAEAVDAIEADDNLPVASITFIIDGGGSTITTGEKGHLEIPFACTINRATMVADRAGTLQLDIWKDTYANFPPTNADSIVAMARPWIEGAIKWQDSTLTGWTTAIVAGDILAFNVDSVTDIQRVTISLKVTKT